ncbi:MAG: hydrogenase maturation protease [Anaerolineae bacterium]|nr:hydrogenase maturation protease [Anaerolineae bacterium]
MDAKTLVIGLGNPILTDDAAGIKVARALRAGPLPAGVDVAELSVGGLALMEAMVGYERAVLIDAIKTRGGAPGQVYTLALDDLPGTLNTASAHDVNLATALATGRRLGAPLPEDADIHIIAIEAEDVLTFGEQCTPAVEAAIPVAARRVLALLQSFA